MTTDDPSAPLGLAAQPLALALADRYRLDRELGHGGMATVYLAHDLKHRRQVAVKVLRPELAAVVGAERFLREIETTANLRHPHILPLYDSGDASGFLYYVMPFVDGGSLRDRLRRERRLPVAEAIQIAREVADALGYAHAHAVIDRDVKPENILLEGGHAVVADFGIARATSAVDEHRLTQTGMAVGTPVYMSPEQALASATLDGRSDLYSLGCVLFEMLTGEPPFVGPTIQRMIARRLTEPAPDCAKSRPTSSRA
jgi:serine/threonine-protein kinase